MNKKLSRQIENCNKLVCFLRKYDRVPSVNGVKKFERDLFHWVIGIRHSRGKVEDVVSKNGIRDFYGLLDRMVREVVGYSDILKPIDRKSIAISKCESVIKFYKDHKRLPYSNSMLGKWIADMKQSKSGKKQLVFYPELDNMVNSAGLGGLFDFVDKKFKIIERCEEIIRFMDIHNGRFPTRYGKNLGEKKVATYYDAICGNSSYVRILNRMLRENGYGLKPSRGDREIAIAKDKCKRLIEFIQKNGFQPRDNGEESELYYFLHSKRQAKVGGSSYKFYSVLDRMVSKAGMNGLFDMRDLKQEAISRCRDLILFIQTHGRYPSKSMINKEEKSLYTYMITKRMAKDGRGKNHNKFYIELDQLVSEAGYPDVFNYQDMKLKAIEHCRELIDFVRINGRLPHNLRNNVNAFEHRLYSYMWSKRLLKRSGSDKFYKEFNHMASEVGFPNMFD